MKNPNTTNYSIKKIKNIQDQLLTESWVRGNGDREIKLKLI